jgi:ABC-2 type transport system ATP-binding protein
MQELFDQQQPFIIVKTAIENDLTKILEIAEAAGHKAHVRDGVAHIEGPAEWAGTLNKLAFDSGILLTQLAPQLPNLEETFFEMTGEQK